MPCAASAHVVLWGLRRCDFGPWRQRSFGFGGSAQCLPDNPVVAELLLRLLSLPSSAHDRSGKLQVGAL
jgi:hypothetical protein